MILALITFVKRKIIPIYSNISIYCSVLYKTPKNEKYFHIIFNKVDE